MIFGAILILFAMILHFWDDLIKINQSDCKKYNTISLQKSHHTNPTETKPIDTITVKVTNTKQFLFRTRKLEKHNTPSKHADGFIKYRPNMPYIE